MAKDEATGGKPTRGLTPQKWRECRRAYESGESMLALAKRLGVRRQTIADRRDRETWTVDPNTATEQVPGTAQHREVRRRTQADVISIATGKAVEAMTASGEIGELAEATLEGLRRHARIEQKMLTLAERTVDAMLNGSLRPGTVTSQASETKDVMAVVDYALKLSREIAGLRPGTPSVAVEDRAKPRALRFITAPVPEADDVARSA